MPLKIKAEKKLISVVEEPKNNFGTGFMSRSYSAEKGLLYCNRNIFELIFK